jgi:hypothetical protein
LLGEPGNGRTIETETKGMTMTDTNETTAKHTPGPWFYVNDGREIHDRITKFDEHGARIGRTPNRIASIDFMPSLFEFPENEIREANARLIAAAPDLLEALLSITEAYQKMFDVMPVAWQTYDDIAIAAIAKAAGKDA